MYKLSIKNWKLNYENYKLLNCSFPCTLYSTLLEHKLIDDPFYRDNEYSLTELSRKDCEFVSVFTAEKELFKHKNILLRFYGIDTLADIYLNGKKLAYVNNMHRTWEFDIKSLLNKGENEIKIHFYSPIEYVEKMQRKHLLWGDANAISGIGHIRKSSCMFGWDWAPKLPDMGIYRDVEILAYDSARIDDVMIHQTHSNGKVVLDFKLSLSDNASVSAIVTVTSPDKETFKADFVDGEAKIEIQSPKLWWPNGLGEHPLYEVNVSLYDGNECIDTYVRNIGLRTLEVSTQKDKWGSEFCFVINGVKFFSMGGDYVPEDSLIARLTPERTEKLIESCIAANHNSIRVWGGAFYPNDYFYDACDRHGLVIWHDFMFACLNVWMTESFEKNIIEEFKDFLKRVRHHASLGLLCGNNEMEDCFKSKDYTIRNNEKTRFDYIKLYETILPDVCEKYAPDTFYWPSSPSSGGGFNNPQDENNGDVHYWGAWHGDIPFESYRQYYFRFCSEFGFEAFPDMKTIRSFTEPSDLNPFSYIMSSHQKSPNGNTKILSYSSDKYLYPTSFEGFVYASQMLQADAIRYGVEHFRRFRGRCMGAIYWQLNDCWPVASWASIDYFGRWKALHYASKRFFAPTLLSAHEEGTSVTLNISNEQLSGFTGSVKYSICENDLSVVYERVVAVSVGAMSAKDIVTEDFAQYIKGNENNRFLSYSLYDSDNNLVSNSSLLFTKPKFFHLCKPETEVSVEGAEGKFKISVKSKQYVKGLQVSFDNADAILSDNFFDITSDEPVIIEAILDDKSLTAVQLMSQISLLSVYDIGK